MTTTNPPCPHCQGTTRKNGTTRSGKQTYRCSSCGKRFSLNPTGRPQVHEGATLRERERNRKRKARAKNMELTEHKDFKGMFTQNGHTYLSKSLVDLSQNIELSQNEDEGQEYECLSCGRIVPELAEEKMMCKDCALDSY